MFNRVMILGRLGQDPEVREAGSVDVMSLSVATSKKWKDRDGDMKEATQWHRCQIWNEQAIKFGREYLSKGDLVMVEGELEYRKWTNKDGVEVTSAEIVFRFNGALAKASSPGGGGDRRDDDRRDDRRSDRRDDRRDDRRGRDDRRDDRGRDDGRGGRDDRRSSSYDRRSSRGDDRDRNGGGRGGWDSNPKGRINDDDLDDDIPF